MSSLMLLRVWPFRSYCLIANLPVTEAEERFISFCFTIKPSLYLTWGNNCIHMKPWHTILNCMSSYVSQIGGKWALYQHFTSRHFSFTSWWSYSPDHFHNTTPKHWTKSALLIDQGSRYCWGGGTFYFGHKYWLHIVCRFHYSWNKQLGIESPPSCKGRFHFIYGSPWRSF